MKTLIFLPLSALLTLGATECQTTTQSQPEAGINSPSECKKAGGYWSSRNCLFGEEAQSARCSDKRPQPKGRYWDWDWKKHRCISLWDPQDENGYLKTGTEKRP